MLEAGRALAGPGGVLVTRVEYLKLDKAKRFAVVDASMSELIRPALYEAYHEIVAVKEPGPGAAQGFDVVGPGCESADVLGTDRSLAIEAGSLPAALAAGAFRDAGDAHPHTGAGAPRGALRRPPAPATGRRASHAVH